MISGLRLQTQSLGKTAPRWGCAMYCAGAIAQDALERIWSDAEWLDFSLKAIEKGHIEHDPPRINLLVASWVHLIAYFGELAGGNIRVTTEGYKGLNWMEPSDYFVMKNISSWVNKEGAVSHGLHFQVVSRSDSGWKVEYDPDPDLKSKGVSLSPYMILPISVEVL